MISASELRPGMAIRRDNELFTVTVVDHHLSGGQLGSMVFVQARSLAAGHAREWRLHTTDKIEDVTLERLEMEYLYADGSGYYFMNPETFEQLSLSREAIGAYEKFLQPNQRVPVELDEGRPVKVVFPDFAELRVVSAPPPLHEHETSTFKTVVLDNGMEALAPQFIREGDVLRIEVASGRYVERVRREGRKV